jgi:small subunit ribosomal protein S17
MRTKKGIVGSTKMTGTVSVTVDRFVFHPIYKKRFKRSKKFLADTNDHDVHEGDTVEITECSPISKRKYFKVTEVIIAVPRTSDVDDTKDEATASKREKTTETVVEKKTEKTAENSASKDATSPESDSQSQA